MSSFNDPSSGGDFIDLNALHGSLLLFDVLGQSVEIQTVNGPASPIRADVTVLDGPHKADRYNDALIFPRVLIGQLRSQIGSKVLGRLGKGEAKPGKNAPWQLSPATADDRVVGEKYLAYIEAQVAAVEEPF